MRKCFWLIILVAAMTVSACATRNPIRWTATATTSSPPTKASIPTLTPEPTSEPHIIVDLTMNVRNGPGTEFDVVGQIEPQKKYAVFGKHVDWWLVDLGNNQSAWVYAPINEIRFVGDAEAVPDIAPPSTPTSIIIAACTPTNITETFQEGTSL